MSVGRVCMLDVQALYSDAIPQDNPIPFGSLPAQLRPANHIEFAINFFDAGTRTACGLLVIEANGSMSVKGPYDPNTGWRWLSGTVTYVI